MEANKEEVRGEKIRKILTDLGMLAVVGGIVTTVCTYLPLDNSEVTTLSIAITLIVATFLYPKYINIKVNSRWAIIPVTILLAVLFFGYKYYEQRNTGLVEFYPQSSTPIGLIPEKINKSQSEIWFCGTNMHITAQSLKVPILEKLKSGIRIKFLVFNPYSRNADLIAADFKQKEEFLRENELGLEALRIMNEEWMKLRPTVSKPGELEIKFYNTIPRARAYFFDPDNEKSECIIIPYSNLVNSPDLPGFRFRNKKEGVFTPYFLSMVKLWEASTLRLEDVITLQAKADSVNIIR